MYKFFVSEEEVNLEENEIVIKGQDVNHIKNVLRLKQNEEIEIAQIQNNKKYVCSIKNLEKEMVICTILKEVFESKESNIYINILQGLPKFEKMEYIIQKCTEIGVKEFTPLEMNRCIVKLDKKTEEKKIERWQRIAEIASKQCLRDAIPKVNNVVSIKNISEIIKNYDIIFLAYENEEENTLKSEIQKLKKNVVNNDIKIGIIIGPEGGIEQSELLQMDNVKIVSLGKRILRTETVALVISSIIMYELDELGGK